VLGDLYRNGTPDPMDITKFEWQVILSYMGTDEEEIVDVQKRAGVALALSPPTSQGGL
jgi:hypothetical protein